MKLKLLIFSLFPLLLNAQQIKVDPQKKTMTPEELSKLGIELPGASFTITGSIKGLKDSTLVILTNMNDGTKLAQGLSVNGHFKLHGQVEHEGLNVISFAGYTDFVTLFMANNSIVVTGDAGHLGALDIKGTAMEDDFVEYRKGFDADARRLSELLQSINTAPQGTKKDTLTKEYKKIVLTKADRFLKNKPASPAACFVLFTVAGLLDTQSELEERFNKLLPDAKKGMYAELIKRKINEVKVNPVGTIAPDFTQNEISGKPFSLHSLRGRYVLIYFWAGWCKQCINEIPALITLYNQYMNRKFSIIGVSLDMDRDSWVKAVTDNKMKWIQVGDLKYWDNEVARLYKIESLPQNILVGPDGKILDKNLTPAQLETKLVLLSK